MSRGVWTAALVACLVATGCRKQTPSLGLLVWEGYADPSFVGEFEKKCQCKVSASYMGSSDELVAKLRGGSASNYDVISPSSDVATMIATTGLAAPIDLSKIPAYKELMPQLTSLPLVKSGGSVYGVPFQWGPNPLLYDTTAFKETPDSWAILWDPNLKGKVALWDDLSSVYMAAQVLGFDKPSPHALYNLTDEQLEKVKAKLIELKPKVRKLWSTGGELTNLFENHEVQIAMGWPLMTNQLRKRNFPIGETIPKENTTGWIDHMMITAASEHKDLAHQFLEYLVEAQTQRAVAAVTGYLPVNPGVAQYLTAEEKKNLHLDDLDNYQKRIYFWENVPRRDKYNQIWNEVKAAQ
jgi:putative spermidine/putrescine transport system substrate-binding protein/spermidine/putrescine transport system substrate-binding protein